MRFRAFGMGVLAVAPLALLALSPAEEKIAAAVSADSLRGHVSFLASDVLQGRDTPSPGLEVAAEYIAAQFRRFGLQPMPGGSYFQLAPYTVTRQSMDGFRFELTGGAKPLTIDPARALLLGGEPGSFEGVECVKVSFKQEDSPVPERTLVEGKVVLLESSLFRTPAMAAKRDALLALGARMVVMPGFVMQGPRLTAGEAAATAGRSPLLVTSDPALRELIGPLTDGPVTLKASGVLPAAERETVQLKNVIGVLPGSDPALSKTFVLLSAHYDHVGVNVRVQGEDKIHNGANDDASGTAVLLELARAFAGAGQRPKRTIVFAAWFGEEKGLLGARYYAQNPVFALKDTVANLNFEHMGRTDDVEGPQVGRVTASGFDYTSLGDLLIEAGKETGVEAWKHERNSDSFFARSDNQAFADQGVPAITLAVAWIFPDYHRPGDHWEKLDYDNMARVTRTCAVVVSRVAESAEAPKWVPQGDRNQRYIDAWKGLTGAQTAQ